MYLTIRVKESNCPKKTQILINLFKVNQCFLFIFLPMISNHQILNRFRIDPIAINFKFNCLFINHVQFLFIHLKPNDCSHFRSHPSTFRIKWDAYKFNLISINLFVLTEMNSIYSARGEEKKREQGRNNNNKRKGLKGIKVVINCHKMHLLACNVYDVIVSLLSSIAINLNCIVQGYYRSIIVQHFPLVHHTMIDDVHCMK